MAVEIKNACCAWIKRYKNNNKSNIENYPTATRARSEPPRFLASQALGLAIG
jgi:hypothetical protein